VEFHLENGDVVAAIPKRSHGRRTVTSAVTGQGLAGRVSRIIVIGRDDRTCAENARYQFLVSTLTRSRRRRPVPFFVNAIWFPKNLKGQSGHQNAGTEPSFGNASHLARLNDSQREVATAMLSVSAYDSLVIAHGIFSMTFSTILRMCNTHGLLITQDLRAQERPPPLRQQPRHG
jgi:hypothetical protein